MVRSTVSTFAFAFTTFVTLAILTPHLDRNSGAIVVVQANSTNCTAKCGNETCSGHGQLDCNTCICHCAIPWTGSKCNECPTSYDPLSGCTECAVGFMGFPDCNQSIPVDPEAYANARGNYSSVISTLAPQQLSRLNASRIAMAVFNGMPQAPRPVTREELLLGKTNTTPAPRVGTFFIQTGNAYQCPYAGGSVSPIQDWSSRYRCSTVLMPHKDAAQVLHDDALPFIEDWVARHLHVLPEEPAVASGIDHPADYGMLKVNRKLGTCPDGVYGTIPSSHFVGEVGPHRDYDEIKRWLDILEISPEEYRNQVLVNSSHPYHNSKFLRPTPPQVYDYVIYVTQGFTLHGGADIVPCQYHPITNRPTIIHVNLDNSLFYDLMLERSSAGGTHYILNSLLDIQIRLTHELGHCFSLHRWFYDLDSTYYTRLTGGVVNHTTLRGKYPVNLTNGEKVFPTGSSHTVYRMADLLYGTRQLHDQVVSNGTKLVTIGSYRDYHPEQSLISRPSVNSSIHQFDCPVPGLQLSNDPRVNLFNLHWFNQLNQGFRKMQDAGNDTCATVACIENPNLAQCYQCQRLPFSWWFQNTTTFQHIGLGMVTSATNGRGYLSMVNSHLSPRWYLYDIMSLHFGGLSTSYSSTFYSALQGTGWYDVDTTDTFVDINPFGRHAGCSFVNKPCNISDWLMPPISIITPKESGIASNSTLVDKNDPNLFNKTSQGITLPVLVIDVEKQKKYAQLRASPADAPLAPYAPRLSASKYSNSSLWRNEFCFERNQQMCTSDHKSIGQCIIQDGISLPPNAQYFPGFPLRGQNSPYTDYCPTPSNRVVVACTGRGTINHNNYCVDHVVKKEIYVEEQTSNGNNNNNRYKRSYYEKAMSGHTCMKVVDCQGDPEMPGGRVSFVAMWHNGSRWLNVTCRETNPVTRVDEVKSNGALKANIENRDRQVFQDEVGKQFVCPPYHAVCGGYYQQRAHITPEPSLSPGNSPVTRPSIVDQFSSISVTLKSYGSVKRYFNTYNPAAPPPPSTPTPVVPQPPSNSSNATNSTTAPSNSTVECWESQTQTQCGSNPSNCTWNATSLRCENRTESSSSSPLPPGSSSGNNNTNNNGTNFDGWINCTAMIGDNASCIEAFPVCGHFPWSGYCFFNSSYCRLNYNTAAACSSDYNCVWNGSRPECSQFVPSATVQANASSSAGAAGSVPATVGGRNMALQSSSPSSSQTYAGQQHRPQPFLEITGLQFNISFALSEVGSVRYGGRFTLDLPPASSLGLNNLTQRDVRMGDLTCQERNLTDVWMLNEELMSSSSSLSDSRSATVTSVEELENPLLSLAVTDAGKRVVAVFGPSTTQDIQIPNVTTYHVGALRRQYTFLLGNCTFTVPFFTPEGLGSSSTATTTSANVTNSSGNFWNDYRKPSSKLSGSWLDGDPGFYPTARFDSIFPKDSRFASANDSYVDHLPEYLVRALSASPFDGPEAEQHTKAELEHLTRNPSQDFFMQTVGIRRSFNPSSDDLRGILRRYAVVNTSVNEQECGSNATRCAEMSLVPADAMQITLANRMKTSGSALCRSDAFSLKMTSPNLKTGNSNATIRFSVSSDTSQGQALGRTKATTLLIGLMAKYPHTYDAPCNTISRPGWNPNGTLQSSTAENSLFHKNDSTATSSPFTQPVRASAPFVLSLDKGTSYKCYSTGTNGFAKEISMEKVEVLVSFEDNLFVNFSGSIPSAPNTWKEAEDSHQGGATTTSMAHPSTILPAMRVSFPPGIACSDFSFSLSGFLLRLNGVPSTECRANEVYDYNARLAAFVTSDSPPASGGLMCSTIAVEEILPKETKNSEESGSSSSTTSVAPVDPAPLLVESSTAGPGGFKFQVTLPIICVLNATCDVNVEFDSSYYYRSELFRHGFRSVSVVPVSCSPAASRSLPTQASLSPVVGRWSHQLLELKLPFAAALGCSSNFTETSNSFTAVFAMTGFTKPFQFSNEPRQPMKVSVAAKLTEETIAASGGDPALLDIPDVSVSSIVTQTSVPDNTLNPPVSCARCNHQGICNSEGGCDCFAGFGGPMCDVCSSITLNQTAGSNGELGVFCKYGCDGPLPPIAEYPLKKINLWRYSCPKSATGSSGGGIAPMDPQRGCQCFCNGLEELPCFYPTRSQSMSLGEMTHTVERTHTHWTLSHSITPRFPLTPLPPTPVPPPTPQPPTPEPPTTTLAPGQTPFPPTPAPPSPSDPNHHQTATKTQEKVPYTQVGTWIGLVTKNGEAITPENSLKAAIEDGLWLEFMTAWDTDAERNWLFDEAACSINFGSEGVATTDSECLPFFNKELCENGREGCKWSPSDLTCRVNPDYQSSGSLSTGARLIRGNNTATKRSVNTLVRGVLAEEILDSDPVYKEYSLNQATPISDIPSYVETYCPHPGSVSNFPYRSILRVRLPPFSISRSPAVDFSVRIVDLSGWTSRKSLATKALADLLAKGQPGLDGDVFVGFSSVKFIDFTNLYRIMFQSDPYESPTTIAPTTTTTPPDVVLPTPSSKVIVSGATAVSDLSSHSSRFTIVEAKLAELQMISNVLLFPGQVKKSSYVFPFLTINGFLSLILLHDGAAFSESQMFGNFMFNAHYKNTSLLSALQVFPSWEGYLTLPATGAFLNDHSWIPCTLGLLTSAPLALFFALFFKFESRLFAWSRSKVLFAKRFRLPMGLLVVSTIFGSALGDCTGDLTDQFSDQVIAVLSRFVNWIATAAFLFYGLYSVDSKLKREEYEQEHEYVSREIELIRLSRATTSASGGNTDERFTKFEFWLLNHFPKALIPSKYIRTDQKTGHIGTLLRTTRGIRSTYGLGYVRQSSFAFWLALGSPAQMSHGILQKVGAGVILCLNIFILRGFLARAKDGRKFQFLRQLWGPNILLIVIWLARYETPTLSLAPYTPAPVIPADEVPPEVTCYFIGLIVHTILIIFCCLERLINMKFLDLEAKLANEAQTGTIFQMHQFLLPGLTTMPEDRTSRREVAQDQEMREMQSTLLQVPEGRRGTEGNEDEGSGARAEQERPQNALGLVGGELGRRQVGGTTSNTGKGAETTGNVATAVAASEQQREERKEAERAQDTLDADLDAIFGTSGGEEDPLASAPVPPPPPPAAVPKAPNSKPAGKSTGGVVATSQAASPPPPPPPGPPPTSIGVAPPRRALPRALSDDFADLDAAGGDDPDPFMAALEDDLAWNR